MVLAAVDDLLFSSRIREAAAAVGTTVIFVRRREAVAPALQSERPALVIIDLDRDALDPIAIIREIRASPDHAKTRVVGYASHMHTDRLQEARDAGCHRVMARSGFVEALPGLLASSVGWSPA